MPITNNVTGGKIPTTFSQSQKDLTLPAASEVIVKMGLSDMTAAVSANRTALPTGTQPGVRIGNWMEPGLMRYVVQVLTQQNTKFRL